MYFVYKFCLLILGWLSSGICDNWDNANPLYTPWPFNSSRPTAGFGIYHSKEAVLEILHQGNYVRLPCVRALLTTYEEQMRAGNPDDQVDLDFILRQPYYIVESTHRRTRVLISKMLASYLHGWYMPHPPRPLDTLQLMFNRQGGFLKKLYYSLSMYVASKRVRELWRERAVVSTSTWLDQAAFSIAQSFGDNLPPPGSDVYQWPSDMVKPDIAFFLNLPVMKYGDETPVNEFKKKLIEVYRRIQGINLIEINSTGVYDKIFLIMKKNIRRYTYSRTGRKLPNWEEDDHERRGPADHPAYY